MSRDYALAWGNQFLRTESASALPKPDFCFSPPRLRQYPRSAPPSPTKPHSHEKPSTPPSRQAPRRSGRPAARRRGRGNAAAAHSQPARHAQPQDPITQTLIAQLTRDSSGKTPEEWQQQQRRLDGYLQQGELYKACRLLSGVALHALTALGADSAEAFGTVGELVRVMDQIGWYNTAVAHWLLPRAVAQWGVEHTTTQQILQQAVGALCSADDLRPHPGFLQLVTDIALQVPRELGIGLTVAPVPDEEAYNRHLHLHSRARNLRNVAAEQPDQLKLAKDMLERCVAYYETLGQHWLASSCKFHCLISVGFCISVLEGSDVAERFLAASKRAAQRELGRTHECSLSLQEAHAEQVANIGRPQQALSTLSKLLRIRQEVQGPLHRNTLNLQVSHPQKMHMHMYTARTGCTCTATVSDAHPLVHGHAYDGVYVLCVLCFVLCHTFQHTCSLSPMCARLCRFSLQTSFTPST